MSSVQSETSTKITWIWQETQFCPTIPAAVWLVNYLAFQPRLLKSSNVLNSKEGWLSACERPWYPPKLCFWWGGVDLFVLLSCFLIRFALRHMYLAVTSGALTPLCGQPSAKCWVTWLYSYDKSKKTWWAFWHQQMVPCPWLHTFLFSFIWMPCGFCLTLPQLIMFKSFLGSDYACLRALTLSTLVGWFIFFSLH